MNGTETDDASRVALASLTSLLPVGPMTPDHALILREMMRQHPQWFVVEKSIWVTDRWRAIAGPFVDPEDAQFAAQRLIEHDMRDGRKDYNTRITTLNETVRIYQDNIEQLAEDLDAAAPRRVASGLA
jgi:hypothetical protein